VTVFGGAELDLRQAILPTREISIRAVCVFGGMSVTVPPEMHVADSGVAVFGGRDICPDSPASLRPEAPVLHLTGACIFGGVEVKRKRRKTRKDENQAAGELTN
jgi:predicted membrane protein